MIKEGKDTSEHQRAIRAEIAGAVILLVGLVLVFIHPWPGVCLCVMGSAIMGANASVYSHGRAVVKAAALTKRLSAPHGRHI